MTTIYPTVIFNFIRMVGCGVSKCSLLASESTPHHSAQWADVVNGPVSVIQSLNAPGNFCRFLGGESDE